MSATAQHGWKLRSGDVPTAFLKQDEKLWSREVYAYPPPELRLAPGQVMRLRKAIYGLVDAPLLEKNMIARRMAPPAASHTANCAIRDARPPTPTRN